jgi:hypothetical protein
MKGRFMQVTFLAPFRPELLDLPDDQLGAHVLADWISYQGLRMGIPPSKLTRDDLQRIRETTLTMEGKDLQLAGLEKVLRLCARARTKDDAAEVGRLFREYMWGEAQGRVDRKYSAEGINRRKQVRGWSKRGASARRKYSDKDRARWRATAATLYGKSASSAAEIIRKKEGLPKTALRTIREELRRSNARLTKHPEGQ